MSSGSLRLNEQRECQGCESKVNPYVDKRDFVNMVMSLECPNCGEKWIETIKSPVEKIYPDPGD